MELFRIRLWGPAIASPSGWLQMLPVSWSHQVIALRYNAPCVPKMISSPSTIAVAQTGHHVTRIGTPPTRSTTISRELRRLTG